MAGGGLEHARGGNGGNSFEKLVSKQGSVEGSPGMLIQLPERLNNMVFGKYIREKPCQAYEDRHKNLAKVVVILEPQRDVLHVSAPQAKLWAFQASAGILGNLILNL